MRRALATTTLLAAGVGSASASTGCTNSYATNYDPSCTAPDCTDDGSCQYPNDPSACSGLEATPIAVRVRVELADEAFEWGIDNSMMSLHRYGPFSHWPADKRDTVMVVCMAAGGHTINYPLPSLNPEQGAGRLSVTGAESAACPSGEESCALFGPADFDPQNQPLTVSFHVGAVPPPPPISDSAMCGLDYVSLFLSFVAGGKCDPGHDQDFHCTDECQADITKVLRECAGTNFTSGVLDAKCEPRPDSGTACALNTQKTGCTHPDCTFLPQGATRTFDEKVVRELAAISPYDCDFSLGYESCESQCSIKSITTGAAFTGLQECVRMVNGHPQWQHESGAGKGCSDDCAHQLDILEEKCGSCTDPRVAEFRLEAGRGLAQCETCHSPYSGIAEAIRDVCCPTGHGCTPSGEPIECLSDEQADCRGTVKEAGVDCPEYFMRNAEALGTYLECIERPECETEGRTPTQKDECRNAATQKELIENLQRKSGHTPGHGGAGGAEDSTAMSTTVVVLMVLGGVALLGAVVFQACTYKAERKEFARDSLAFARDGPSIYDARSG